MAPAADPAKDVKSVSKSGIVESANGERRIPSSVRADGSVRKEIRIRPGYRPPEDVEVYRSRPVEARKSRQGGGVPGASFVNPPKPKKPAEPKPARAKEPSSVAAQPPKTTNETADGQNVAAQPEQAQEEEPVDPEAEKLKEARKLSKKIRQARELQQKTDKGSVLLPEQIQKVIQIAELTRRLDKLGFDQEGNKKPES